MWPATHNENHEPISPALSHERCHLMGAGNIASPTGEFAPCPCSCHLGDELYECANCGGYLREAPMWPNEDEPGEMVYVHIDPTTGRATGEECGG
jgi:hypothetical protein